MRNMFGYYCKKQAAYKYPEFPFYNYDSEYQIIDI